MLRGLKKTGVRSALSGRRVYAVALVAIGLATIGGMIALWPRGELPPAAPGIEGTELLRHTYSAEIVSSTNYPNCCQQLVVEVTEGPDAGKREDTEVGSGPGLPSYGVGDAVRVGKYANTREYRLVDFDRRLPLLWLALAFVALVIIFGRLRGALSLLGLAISFLIILVFVVPAILHDSPPLPVALVGSMAVMLTTIPLAHGLGPKSLAAMAGIAASLVVIVGLAIFSAHMAHLTGLTSGEDYTVAYLHLGINFQSLLIGGMVIGALGVLDDVAISQASTVLALRKANPRLSFGQLFRQAIDVGRDHVSAVVNTLVLAYAGTSLITLLSFSSGGFDLLDAVNLGGPASVIVASMVGSIGLICAVPITTALAALLAESMPAEELAAEEHLGHAH
jgi:uncharacterized membrane protein